jgi:cobalt-zinc-cadmium efflux system outer membrane protein
MLAACVPNSPYTRDYVSRALQAKTGHPLAAASLPGEERLPPGVLLDDGLTEDEAVAIALWNNAEFRVRLSDLAIAQASLTEAGQLPNPLLSFLNLFGVKGRESYLLWPVDALVQRPARIKAARLAAGEVADGLVQHGLYLGRDVLLAYADLTLAESAAGMAGEEAEALNQVASLASSRLRAGDISGIEESAARVEALRAEDAAGQALRALETARSRFVCLLGWRDPAAAPKLTPGTPAVSASAAARPLAELIEAAYKFRPDIEAARMAIDAAGARLGWERSRVLKLTATLEAKEKGESGFFVGPSGKIEIPIFNRNEGGKARAEAELAKAAERFVALRLSVAGEVREAYAELEACRRALSLAKEGIVPAAAEALRRAEKAQAAGEESLLHVLEARRGWVRARGRLAEAEAECRRAAARLNSGLGAFSLPSEQ